MNLKEEIVKALENSPLLNLFPITSVPHSSLEELDASDLIILCIPFINAKYFEDKNKKEESISEYRKFLFYVEDLMENNLKC